MDIQFFKSAWGDIRNSPGWFGKLCLIALLNFIPVFGQIVTFAYAYGWAREIAWGTHEPMPYKIFSNDDGKFWRRGWFILVLAVVFGLIPGILYIVGASIESATVVMTFFGPYVQVDPFLEGLGTVLRIVGFVLAVLVGILAWVGSMRIAIYDRLSAGFQLGKVWKMLRHDTGGIFRIFGMELLVSLVIGFVLSIVFAVLVTIVITAGVAGVMGAGYSLQALQYMTQAQALEVALRFVAAAGVPGILSLLIGTFLVYFSSAFIQVLVARAMGYWTMQFEVPIWGGQDDPMPFELVHEPEPVPDAFMGQITPLQPQRAAQPEERRSDHFSGEYVMPSAAAPATGGIAATMPASAAEERADAGGEVAAAEGRAAAGAEGAVAEERADVGGEVAAAVEQHGATEEPESVFGGVSDEPGPEASEDEVTALPAESMEAWQPEVTYETNYGETGEVLFAAGQERSDASRAHGPHGVQDGKAGDADVGEDG